jgi:hypothetical protein
MGCPCNALIPPAILLDNPGVTREEFVELLNATHSTWITRFEVGDDRIPWDYSKHPALSECEEDNFHCGLHGLAGLLNLKETKRFKETRKGRRDKFGIPVHLPFLSVNGRKEGYEWRDPYYEVTYTTKHEVDSKTFDLEDISFGKLQKGDFLWDSMGFDILGFIDKVVSEIFLGVSNKYSEGVVDDPFNVGATKDYEVYMYRLKLIEFTVWEKKERYDRLRDLIMDFPQFDPDFKFDFSTSKGNFRMGMENDADFKWFQEDGKYYFDPETLDHIPPGGAWKNGGYSGLIATAEAIKQNAWKLLSYLGFKHLDSFLEDFPESRKRYEQAVWDAQTSWCAKQTGMTYTELLRLTNMPRTPYPGELD